MNSTEYVGNFCKQGLKRKWCPYSWTEKLKELTCYHILNHIKKTKKKLIPQGNCVSHVWSHQRNKPSLNETQKGNNQNVPKQQVNQKLMQG
jgi:hypothetical protein